jgi:hypothetical protein
MHVLPSLVSCHINSKKENNDEHHPVPTARSWCDVDKALQEVQGLDQMSGEEPEPHAIATSPCAPFLTLPSISSGKAHPSSLEGGHHMYSLMAAAAAGYCLLYFTLYTGQTRGQCVRDNLVCFSHR